MVSIVKNLVPEGVELIDRVVVLEREHVGSLVTLRELRVVSVLAVEGLHKIADVVDEKAQAVGLADILIVAELVHQVGVDVAVLVVIALLAAEPGDDIVEGSGQVAVGVVDIVVGDRSFLDVGVVDEMEITLPALSVVLEVISEGGALNESVLVLVRNPVVQVVFAEVGQHLVGLIKGARRLLLKDVLRNVGHIEVTVDGPGSGDAGKGSDQHNSQSLHDEFKIILSNSFLVTQ